ncbi:MAG: TonB-dependent receptor domain-containing protein, partial [Bacteroidia bacterium]
MNNILSGQQVTISGVITEQGSGETLPGVSIYCPKSQSGVISNNYGFYSISIPADSATLIFRMIGYEPIQYQVNAKTTRKDVRLVKQDLELKEVEITADRSEQRVAEVTQMSSIEIPIEQIKKIPALFGEKDVLKVIQLLPGVQKGSEGTSGFYVRGGGPDQNLIILDDAVVYNASHLFGFFSIFNGDALKSVELIKGGFPARFGGRLSSVLEMQMKDGNKEKLQGEAGIGLISSRLTLEGPIQKNKSSFLVSGRRTYIDALIYPFLSAEEKGGYFFYDFNAKAHFILNENDRLYVSGYFGKDKFYFRSQSEDGSLSKGSFLWQNATATARFNHIINNKAFSNTSLIFSRYNLGINSIEEPIEGDDFELNFSSGIRDWTLKHDIDYFANPNHYIRTGASVTYHRFTPNAIVIKAGDDYSDIEESERYDCLENGIYAEDDWKINAKLKVNTGLRFSHFLAVKKNYFGIEPRISGRYLLRD